MSANHWKVEDSLELYQVPYWGRDYFGINAAGHVIVRPNGPSTPPEQEIDLLEVIQGLQARDLTAPVVLRFADILKHRVARCTKRSARAIEEKTNTLIRIARCFPSR